MLPDDELCLCFHVTKRKVVNFLQVEKPQRASQMSECFGAGTGCGWCRPYLCKLFEAAQEARRHPHPGPLPRGEGELTAADSDLPDAAQYAAGRSNYVK